MGRLNGFRRMSLVHVWMIGLCLAVLVSLLLISLGAHAALASSDSAGAGAAPAATFPTRTPTPKPPTATPTPKPTATNTPKPTPTKTPQPTATRTPKPTATRTPLPTATATLAPTATAVPPTATATSTAAAPGGIAPGGDGIDGAAEAAPPWLLGGLGALFGSLVLFALIAFPLSHRLARQHASAKRPMKFPSSAGVLRPPSMQPATERITRMSQIPPVRREPLSHQQMRALHEEQERRAGVSRESSGMLAAVRLVDGVPVTLPISEQETVPRLPGVLTTSGKRPVVGLIVDGTSGKHQAVRKQEPMDG